MKGTSRVFTIALSYLILGLLSHSSAAERTSISTTGNKSTTSSGVKEERGEKQPVIRKSTVPKASKTGPQMIKPKGKEPLTPLGPGKESPPKKPDLTISKIWLDNQCRIHCLVMNLGPGGISSGPHKICRMKMFSENQEHDFSLAHQYKDRKPIDPHGKLRAPGGMVSFNTGVRLESQGVVRLWVDSTGLIHETDESNNQARENLAPGCMNALDTARMQPTHPGQGLTTASKLSLAAGPTVKINSFSLRRGTEMLMAGSGTFTGAEEYTVDVMEEFTLSFHVTGTNATDVDIQIRGYDGPDHTGPHTVPHITEDRRDEDNRYSIVGTATLRQMEDKEYVLKVRATGRPGMGSTETERVLRVFADRPKLVLETPEVNEDDLSVTFYLSNQGTLDYPEPGADIDGGIRVTNWNGSITYATESIYQRELPLPRGGRVEIAHLTLTDREHLYAAGKILIEAQARDTYDFFKPSCSVVSHLHEWSTNNAEMDTEILLGFFTTLAGAIRLNNYQDPGSNSTPVMPGVSNDSSLEIAGDSTPFTPPFLRVQLLGKRSGKIRFDYRAFFNDISATFGGRRSFSIPETNVVQMEIPFETGGGEEVKGYRYDDESGAFVDDAAPDIDVSEFTLEVSFYLALRDGRITIDRIYIRPILNWTITDRYAWILNKLRTKFEGFIQNELARSVRDLVDVDDFSDRLNDEISRTLGALGVGWINHFELNSERLTISYVPE